MTDLVQWDTSHVSDITPAAQEYAVSAYLQNARDWLATAVEVTGPEQIAMAKASIATAAEATKQLNLSKEIQLDAQEMVRRAEYALGKAIRKGQKEGQIASQGDIGGSGAPGVIGGIPGRSRGEHLARPHVVAGEHKAALSAIYQLSDGVTADEFDRVLDGAKAEGNLSRANVVRKVRGESKPQGDRHELLKRTRRHNSNRIVDQTVTGLEGYVLGLELVELDQLDPEKVDTWVSSLSKSIQSLNRLNRQLKELNQA